jgi:repressor LexA
MKILTKRQLEVYNFIARYIDQYGYPPSRVEISTSFNFKSPNSAQTFINVLVTKGFIETVSGKTRAIRLIKPTGATQSTIPLIGRVAAGLPIVAIEHSESISLMDSIDFNPKADYLLRVIGESMIDFGILSGDIVAIYKTQKIENGSLMVVRIDDEATLKKIFHEEGYIRLKAGNKKFDDLVYSLTDSVINIEGKVVGVIRRY